MTTGDRMFLRALSSSSLARASAILASCSSRMASASALMAAILALVSALDAENVEAWFTGLSNETVYGRHFLPVHVPLAASQRACWIFSA